MVDGQTAGRLTNGRLTDGWTVDRRTVAGRTDKRLTVERTDGLVDGLKDRRTDVLTD